MTQNLQLELVRTDGGTQPRQGISWEVVNQYGDLMEGGVKLPPVTVFYDGTNYWLADGFHRLHAAENQERAEITAEIIQGTLEDAQWYSFGANKAHGLMRTNEDKQRAVQAALRHPKCAGLSDRAIAKHVGVTHPTVSGWREKLSGKTFQIETRTVTRHGTTYQQNTANIGKKITQQQTAAASTVTAPEQAEAEAEAHSEPTLSQELCDSDELLAFVEHIEGVLSTPLTYQLLADEIDRSVNSKSIKNTMEKVNEFLKAVSASASSNH